MKYVYLVVYVTRERGTGRVQVTRDKEITSIVDIEGIEEDLEHSEAAITNYILMNTLDSDSH